MSDTALELNLISALNRLQHLVLDKEFLGNVENIAPEFVSEQYFSFHIGEYHFVVNAQCFCAVFVETPIAAVPNSPSCLVGLSNIRGALMPIYQLHTALGYAQPKKQFIFCIGKAENAVGLLIDTLPISLFLSPQDRVQSNQQHEHDMLKKLVNQFYFSTDKLWRLLQGEKIGAQLLAIAGTEQKQNFLSGAKIIDNKSAVM